MECCKHQGVAASGTCQICGKGLCTECGNRFSTPLCETCFLQHNSNVAKKMYFDIAITLIIFIAGTFILRYALIPDYKGAVILALGFSCAYWGWQFLNRIPMPTFFTSGFGFIMVLFVKFSISMFAGFIIAPIEIIKRVIEIMSIRKLERQVKDGSI